MGYSMRTDRYRYTEWVLFEYAPEYKPDWTKVNGTELYDHAFDPEENHNQAYDIENLRLVKMLSELLHAGWRSVVEQ
jgi:iduronate 2-sulfatase